VSLTCTVNQETTSEQKKISRILTIVDLFEIKRSEYRGRPHFSVTKEETLKTG
jgi:hypothetical protein